MVKPAEVQLKPGWLQDDVRRAQSRLHEWSGRSLRTAEVSTRSPSEASGSSRTGLEQKSNTMGHGKDTSR
jgi:hypothetical protein